AASTGEHRPSVSLVNCALAGAPDATKTTLYEELRALGAPIDFHSVNIVMSALVRQDRIGDAAALADAAPCPLTTVNYNTLMLAHARADRPAALADAYRRMRAHGILPDHVTFNAAVSAAVRCAPRSAGAAALGHVISDMSNEAHVTP